MTEAAHQRDLTGTRFGRLTVIIRAGSNSHGDAVWKCECTCGTVCEIRASSLRRGTTRSCGCKGVPHRTKGHWTNPAEHGIKHHGSGAIWFDTGPASLSSKSSSRKMASAMIAKIPLPLGRHIARTFRPSAGAPT